MVSHSGQAPRPWHHHRIMMRRSTATERGPTASDRWERPETIRSADDLPPATNVWRGSRGMRRTTTVPRPGRSADRSRRWCDSPPQAASPERCSTPAAGPAKHDAPGVTGLVRAGRRRGRDGAGSAPGRWPPSVGSTSVRRCRRARARPPGPHVRHGARLRAVPQLRRRRAISLRRQSGHGHRARRRRLRPVLQRPGPDTGPHPITRDDLHQAFAPGTGWRVGTIERSGCSPGTTTRMRAPAWLATLRRVRPGVGLGGIEPPTERL